MHPFGETASIGRGDWVSVLAGRNILDSFLAMNLILEAAQSLDPAHYLEMVKSATPGRQLNMLPS